MAKLWIWIAAVVGILYVSAEIIYFIIERKRIPLYIFIMSAVGFVAGIAYGCISYQYQSIGSIIKIALLCLAAPPIIWFLCGGPICAPKRGVKNKSKNDIAGQ